MIGQTISHYKILEKLGEGGMGVVYKAEDTTLDRFVALKFLPPSLQAGDQEKARFIQEAKAAAALNHPNICSVIAIEECDGQMFIVMEFVDGQTLRDKRASLPLPKAIDIGIQIADGLAAAHEKGIVHRDIKPENIMIRKDGIAQIMDFGLAKLRASTASRITKEGSTVGTAGYMSPEQIQGHDVDHRSDIFSMGVLLYELFSGELPFRGVHETAMLYEIVNVDPAPMSASKPGIDPELDRIVLECLQKEPDERYQAAKDISKDLRRFKRESSRQRMSRTIPARRFDSKAGPAPAAEEASAAEADARQPKRFILPALCAILAVTTLLFAWSPWRKEAVRETQVMRFPINLPLTTPLVAGAATVAISPDGRFIVYLAQSAGTGMLFLRPIDQFTGHPIPGTEGAADPFFSPNGEWIAYFGRGKLQKVSIFGGAPQVICNISGFMRGAWWDNDDLIWFGHINSTVYRVSSNGGNPEEMTRLDTANQEISHRFPQPLPDGKSVLYTIKQSNISTFDDALIAVEDFRTHERKIIVRGGSFARYIPTGHILYAHGSAVFALPFNLAKLEVTGPPLQVLEGGMLVPESGDANFTVSQTGTLVYVPRGSVQDFQVRLVWIDPAGKREPMLDTIRAYGDGTISPDGQKVAMTIRAANDDIWVYHIARGTLTRLTFGGGNSDFPTWTPDGKRVVYASERQRSIHLYWKPWDGSGSEEKLGDADDLDGSSPASISPDGKLIAYGRRGDIWTMPLTNDGKSEPFIQSPATELDPSFSPDGHLMSYTTTESGHSEVCVVPFPSRDGKWQVSPHGGFFGRWLRSGTEMVYLNGTTVMKVDLRFSPAFDFSAPKKLFDIPAFNGFFDPSPDGKHFLYGDLESRHSDVTDVNVVVGWFDELRKKFSDNSK